MKEKLRGNDVIFHNDFLALNYVGVDRIFSVGVASRDIRRYTVGESIFPCIIDVNETKVGGSNRGRYSGSPSCKL